MAEISSGLRRRRQGLLALAAVCRNGHLVVPGITGFEIHRSAVERYRMQ